MNSDIKTMMKEAGILFAITLISGLVLGFFHELTADPIAKQQAEAVRKACNAVFAEAASFEETEYTVSSELAEQLATDGVKTGTVYKALASDGTLLGHVIESASTKGYGGEIVLYLGVKTDGTLNDISILSISETPGLGMRAEEVLVPQFHDKSVSTFVYTKNGAAADNEIDAISGATITTKAVTAAVNDGLALARELTEGGAANE